MKRRLIAILTTATLRVALASPEAEFAVPVMGYVYDRAGAQVRALTGTPGAATAAVGVGIGDYERTVVASDGTFALVSVEGAETLSVHRSSETGLYSIGIAFDSAAINAANTRAALYLKACHCVRILTDLRTEPKLDGVIPLGEGVEVRALAVSSQRAAIATTDGRVLFDTPVEVALAATALSFDPAGERLLAVDAAGRKVYVLSVLTDAPAVTELSFPSPVAAVFGASGSILVADAEQGVLVWSEADRSSTAIECLCRPSTIEPTATAGMYRLSALESGAVWMLDLSAESPRTFFVPVRREAAE